MGGGPAFFATSHTAMTELAVVAGARDGGVERAVERAVLLVAPGLGLELADALKIRPV